MEGEKYFLGKSDEAQWGDDRPLGDDFHATFGDCGLACLSEGEQIAGGCHQKVGQDESWHGKRCDGRGRSSIHAGACLVARTEVSAVEDGFQVEFVPSVIVVGGWRQTGSTTAGDRRTEQGEIATAVLETRRARQVIGNSYEIGSPFGDRGRHMRETGRIRPLI